MRGVIALTLLILSGCAITPTPKPTPVPGASCDEGCHRVYEDLGCGNHPVDVYVCVEDCKSGHGDPECMAGAETCAQARGFCG
jgi:hypothetical protein